MHSSPQRWEVAAELNACQGGLHRGRGWCSGWRLGRGVSGRTWELAERKGAGGVFCIHLETVYSFGGKQFKFFLTVRLREMGNDQLHESTSLRVVSSQ
jgi:hypothetical protein